MKVPASTRPSITLALTPAASARLDLVQISPFLACFDDAYPRRRHSRRRVAGEAHAVAWRRRIEGAPSAHHHAEHHAGRGERVSRHPVEEIERDRRELRHVVDRLDDGFQLVALDLGGGLVGSTTPNHAEIFDRAQGRDHELAGLDLHALGHEIVVGRGQSQRQQHGYGFGVRLRFGQGRETSVKGREGTLLPYSSSEADDGAWPESGDI